MRARALDGCTFSPHVSKRSREILRDAEARRIFQHSYESGGSLEWTDDAIYNLKREGKIGATTSVRRGSYFGAFPPETPPDAAADAAADTAESGSPHTSRSPSPTHPAPCYGGHHQWERHAHCCDPDPPRWAHADNSLLSPGFRPTHGHRERFQVRKDIPGHSKMPGLHC